MKVHYPKLYNMAQLLALNVFSASKGSNNYSYFFCYLLIGYHFKRHICSVPCSVLSLPNRSLLLQLLCFHNALFISACLFTSILKNDAHSGLLQGDYILSTQFTRF